MHINPLPAALLERGATQKAHTMADIFEGLDNNGDFGDTSPQWGEHDQRAPFASAVDASRFILAGKAIVTLESEKTGNRFTYKISAPKDKETNKTDLGSDFRFVSVLVGPDNWSNYKYFGYIRRGVFFHGGAKAKIAVSAPSAGAFDWAWRALARGTMPESLRIWHEGACGRCGLRLTVPESIKSGFGPECIKHVGL